MPTRLLQASDALAGAYLTDGRSLFRVVDGESGEVALENCRCPEENPRWVGVAEVREKMRRVVPESRV